MSANTAALAGLTRSHLSEHGPSGIQREKGASPWAIHAAADCALSVALGLIPVSILECAKLVRRMAGRSASGGGGD